MNDKGVCGTAPAIPGLLNSLCSILAVTINCDFKSGINTHILSWLKLISIPCIYHSNGCVLDNIYGIPEAVSVLLNSSRKPNN